MIAFVVVGLAAVAAAIGVVAARNAVHSVLWLIVHLCSLAVLYMTLHAQFLGLVQVLLYAGAVMVLFLFVLSLLSARSAASVPSGDQPGAQVFLATAAGFVVAAVLLIGALFGALARSAPGQVAAAFGGAAAFGAALFGQYLLPFEATALALLTAIVAAVALSHGHDEAMRGGTRRSEPEPAATPIDVSHTTSEPEPALGGRRS